MVRVIIIIFVMVVAFGGSFVLLCLMMIDIVVHILRVNSRIVAQMRTPISSYLRLNTWQWVSLTFNFIMNSRLGSLTRLPLRTVALASNRGMNASEAVIRRDVSFAFLIYSNRRWVMVLLLLLCSRTTCMRMSVTTLSTASIAIDARVWTEQRVYVRNRFLAVI